MLHKEDKNLSVLELVFNLARKVKQTPKSGKSHQTVNKGVFHYKNLTKVRILFY